MIITPGFWLSFKGDGLEGFDWVVGGGGLVTESCPTLATP